MLAWCPSTEEQGFAGSEAPRPTGRNPILLQRRGARRRKNKALRGAKHHAQPAEIRFCSKGVVPGDGRTRFCGERSTTSNRLKSDFAPKTWCPTTEEQGFAGSEAPRSTRRSPILFQRRGARRRKNKVLRGAKHHVQPAEARFCSKDVVPDDERIGHCGERSTTPNRPKSDFAPKTWCPATEEQGFAGSEAPRPTGRNPILLQRRGARRRKNVILRGAKHHVQPAEIRFCSKDVVPGDERTRHCGE